MVRARTSRVIVAMLAAVVVAGCGGPATEDDVAPAEAASSAFPVTIEHALGSTTIPAEPQRIVALSWEEDTLGALGITPVAYGQNPYQPGGDFPWLEGHIDLSGSTELANVFTELPLEQIAALDPDLILATNFYGLETVYDQLSAIAPTVGFAEQAGTSTWQDVSREIGTAVGRADEVDQVVADTEQQVADLAAALPGLSGRTFSSSYYYAAGQPLAVIDDPATISVGLYQSLGLVLSPSVTSSVVDRSLSLENVGALDADFVSIGFETPELETAYEGDPLFQSIPAVQAQRAYAADAFTAGAFNNPTLLNVPWQLEQIRPVLERVAAG
jgi:iron complex transport system substrate-binding protein